MNVESKIWKYSNTGTTVHAFDGVNALCRPSITRFTSNAGIDFCEAQTHRICTKCVAKFNAIIEAAEAVTEAPAPAPAPAEAVTTGTLAEAVTETLAEQDATHPDAGTYNPMDGADYLKVQGLYVVAEVHTDGTYAVFVQSQRIARGRLEGTEGSLMRFFGNIAKLWSARIDDERAQEAARRAEAEYAHHAEADPAGDARTPDQIATVVEALGGNFKKRTPNEPSAGHFTAGVVIDQIRNARQYGYKVEMRDNPEGHEYPWHVALLNMYGATRVQYHYMGH